VALLVTKGTSGSAAAGATASTGSATGTGDPTTGPSTDDTAGTPSGTADPGGTASPGTTGTAPGTVGTPTPTPTHMRTPLPTYPASGRMVPPTLVSARATGCTAQTGGGWLAEFAVTFSGGSSWTVLPERGPVHGAQGQWTVGVETKDATITSLALPDVQVGGGTPFTSARVTVPDGPVVAACPS
jgi:hypothetical protein